MHEEGGSDLTEGVDRAGVGIRLEGRPFRSFVSRFTLEAGPEVTTVVSTIEMELRPALKLLWPIVGPFVRRRRRAAFRDLKTLLATLDVKASEAKAQTRT